MSLASEDNKTAGRDTDSFNFTLILAGVDELSDELSDALFEAGCDDALLGVQEETLFLDFTREAASFAEAIVSAIQDVENAGVDGLEVIEVRPPQMNTIDLVNAFLTFRRGVHDKSKDFQDRAWELLLKSTDSHRSS